MLRRRFTPVPAMAVLALFLAAGCGERQPAAPTAVTAGAPEFGVHAGNPVVLSITGSAHATGPLNGTTAAGWRTFAITAVQRRDGSVSGEVQYHQRAEYPGNVIQHGSVSCIKDIGSGVMLIAARGTKRIADQNPAPFPGLPPAILPDNDGLIFAVRDNGEGANSAPDQFTAVIHTLIPVANAVCAGAPGNGFNAALAQAFFNNAEAGDIQVRR